MVQLIWQISINWRVFYINHSTRTEEADTIRMVYSMLAPEYMSTSYKEGQNKSTHPRVMVERQGSV